MSNEPFVDIDAAAAFTGLKRRFLQSLARRGIRGAYAVGTGQLRRRWIFRLNELAEALAQGSALHSRRQTLINIGPDVVLRRRSTDRRGKIRSDLGGPR